jgi:hypothetical protein
MGEAMDREETLAEGKRPFTVSQLLSNAEEGRKKRLLCVHCMPTSETLLRARSQTVGQTNPNGTPKAMDIHGVRQHLKIKFVSFFLLRKRLPIKLRSRHKIDDMRNEDIYFLDGTPHAPMTTTFPDLSSVRQRREFLTAGSKQSGYYCWECRSSDRLYNAKALAAHFRGM